MSNKVLSDSLVEKLQKEIANYKSELVKEPKKIILNASYQTCVKEEMKDIVSYHADYMTDKELKVLNNTNNLIDILYYDWLGYDSQFSEEILQSTFQSISRLVNKAELDEREK